MSIECGSQAILCDLPVRIDNYKGCSHACSYCFVKNKLDITKIEVVNCETSLKKWINGERKANIQWCDWDIPLHWGGVSDPFQPAEKIYKNSFNCFSE